MIGDEVDENREDVEGKEGFPQFSVIMNRHKIRLIILIKIIVTIFEKKIENRLKYIKTTLNI